MKGSKAKAEKAKLQSKKSDSVISDVLGVEQKREFRQLFEIFAQFDTDGSGSISVQQWREAMKRFGHEASEEEVQEMLRENSIKYGQDLTLFEFIGLINKQMRSKVGRRMR